MGLRLYNEDNLKVLDELYGEVGQYIDLIYADCIYESKDYRWVWKSLKLLKPNGIFIVQTDHHTVADYYNIKEIPSTPEADFNICRLQTDKPSVVLPDFIPEDSIESFNRISLKPGVMTALLQQDKTEVLQNTAEWSANTIGRMRVVVTMYRNYRTPDIPAVLQQFSTAS